MAKTFYGDQIEALIKAQELCEKGGAKDVIPRLNQRINWMRENDWELPTNWSDVDEKSDIDKAVDYVREQLDADELMIYKATVSKNLNHRMPATAGLDCDKVIDLLEEYGQENDLPEGWWENEGDIDEILTKL